MKATNQRSIITEHSNTLAQLHNSQDATLQTSLALHFQIEKE